MDARVLRSRFGILRREVVARSLGALLLAAVAVPAIAPAVGAEDGDVQNLVPGQVPAPGQIDSDFDGLSNIDESRYGLNPNNPDTDGDLLFDGDELYNRYGYSYPNLADSDGDGLSDGNEVFALRGFRTDPIRFDSDGDGHGDGAEIYKGTNPLDASSR